MTLTKEQLDIVNYNGDKDLYIDAAPGAGKTTTLVEFAKARPRDSFLYLSYNTRIKKEASSKFTGNTTVKTLNAFAYEYFGNFFQHKFSPKTTIYDIINSFEDLKKMNNRREKFAIANGVLDGLDWFLNSSHSNLSDIELPYKKYIMQYWQKMQNTKDMIAKMTHDGIVKLFALSEIDAGYKYILVDEAQDLNQVMLTILKNQKSSIIIYVGDKNQSIYGFRNTVNVLNFDENKLHLPLSQSFRFNEGVAAMINKFMKYYKGDNYAPIKGNPNVPYKAFDNNRHTVISRTNAHLFELAYSAIMQGKKVAIMGDAIEEVFSEIKDGINLLKGETHKIKSKQIKMFYTFEELEEVASKHKNQELMFLSKIINKYKFSLSNMIKVLENKLVGVKNAEIVFTTAHKSKGLEFDFVKLADDFINLYDKNGKRKPPMQIDSEEINIYYVAMSRVKYALVFENTSPI